MIPESQELIDLVRQTYAGIAEQPLQAHPIPNGRELAVQLGYPQKTLDSISIASVQAYSGVSNVAQWTPILPDQSVLDLGCGAGLDSLIAASKGALVTGVDFCSSMLAVARDAASSFQCKHPIDFRLAEAHKLPYPDHSFDIAMVNGLFNLNPSRAAIICELFRVLKPGGNLYAAEIVRSTKNSIEVTTDNWLA